MRAATGPTAPARTLQPREGRRPRPRGAGAGLSRRGRLTSPPQQQRGHGAVHAAGQGAHDVPRRQHPHATSFSNRRRRFRAAPEVPPPPLRSADVARLEACARRAAFRQPNAALDFRVRPSPCPLCFRPWARTAA